MREFLDGKLIGMQLRAKRCFSQLAEEENGDTNFVAIIIIIVILIGVAAVFRPALENAINDVFSKLDTFIKSE